jgi:hypothetical protein
LIDDRGERGERKRVKKEIWTQQLSMPSSQGNNLPIGDNVADDLVKNTNTPNETNSVPDDNNTTTKNNYSRRSSLM